ncbi:MAG: SurA N-terminal domain-containing protein [Chlamydiota bacterium]|nr:SurA N-terminal domain-containing protein [Chlamydiota bacterium]
MLKSIRKNTKLILWVLLAFIVPPFIFFGIESAFIKKDDPYVATIFNKKLRLSEKLRQQWITSNMLRISYPTLWQKFDVEQHTWQRLLFETYAKQLGLKVSNTELSDAIIKMFTVGEVFSQDFYQKFVSQQTGMSISDFELSLRNTLLVQKFQNTISIISVIPEHQLLKRYMYENEQIYFAYTVFLNDQYIKDQTIDQKDMLEYYQTNQESYRSGPERQIRYIKIAFDEVLKKTTIDSQDVESYYEEHKQSYTGEDDRITPFSDVRDMITVQLKEKQAERTLQKQVYELYDYILEEHSFEDIIKKYSYRFEQSPFISFDDKYLKWEQNPRVWRSIHVGKIHEILEPFRIGKDYYFAEPMEEKPTRLLEFREVEEKIRETLVKSKARDAAQSAARALRSEILVKMEEKHISFEESSQELNLTVMQFDPFTRKDPLVGQSPLKTVAWNLKPGEVSSVLPVEGGYAFGSVLKYEKPSLIQFNEGKERYQDMQTSQYNEALMFDLFQWFWGQCSFIQSQKNPESNSTDIS